IAKVRGVAKKERTTEPAEKKAAAAQHAAEPPANERLSKAEARQAGKMQQAETPAFDAAGFEARLMERIAQLAPKTADEADTFKGSGKLDGVTGQMQGDVAQEQGKSQGPLEEQTKAAPDAAGIEEKPVAPLAPEQAGAAPPPLDAERAAPKPRTAAEVEAPLKAETGQIDQELAEGDVDKRQLEESNEPEFQAASEASEQAREHAAQAPQGYRQEEQAQLGQARAEAGALAGQQTQAMHAGRAQALQQVAGRQAQTKSKDEQQRAQVAADIQAIFAETKSAVEAKLAGLDAKVAQAFDEGANAAKQTFENYVKEKVDAYKERRYGGWFGWARWLKDKVAGMPAEVNTIYAAGRDLYLKEMRAVVRRVAQIVATTLNEAKAEVARGRQRIEEYVARLPANLKQIGQEAAADVQSQLDGLDDAIKNKEGELIESLAQKYNERLKEVDARIEAMKEANKGLVQKAVGAIKGVIETIKKLKDMLLNVLAKAASVIGNIIKHPISFLGNLIGAIKQGFNQFIAKLPEYLKKGLIGWLFGALADAGIQLPESFDLKGVLHLVLQLLGLTYANIRARAVKIVGEAAVARLEQVAEVFKILVTEGPAGLWKFIQDKLGELKEQAMEALRSFIAESVIKAGITWLLSMLNPASAFIKACKMIYDVVMFFIERGSQIMALVNAILDGVSAVAAGSIGAAANRVEEALGRAIPVAISFLASLLGLGGIAGKVKEVIGKIQRPVNALIDKVVGGALKLAKKVVGGVKGALGTKPERAQQKQERLAKGLRAGVRAVEKLRGRRLTEGMLRPVLHGVRTFYKLSRLEPFEKEGYWAVRADIQRMAEARTTVKKTQADLKAEVTKRLKALGLSNDAIGRIFAKAPNVGHIKGQILEEIKRTQVLQETAAGKAKGPDGQQPTAKSRRGKPVFFAGHRVKDANGRQFSDGLIGAWEGDILHVVKIIESKAGPLAAGGLAERRLRLSRDDWRELYREAVEELRRRRADLARTHSSVILKQHRAEVRAIVRELLRPEVQTEEGQARADIERLVPNFGAGHITILIDGKPVKATGSPSSTTIAGVVPKDIDSKQIAAAAQATGLKVEIEHAALSEPELFALASQVADAAGESKAK
ncbi:MAG TPA: hypothetical protein VNL77_15235, partial [Roseiflexaceae bacterium]|nr:hypothetical protein [Roseiflexaceae bacterium]